MLFWLKSIFSRWVLNAWKVISFSLVNKLSFIDKILRSWRWSSVAVGNTDNKFFDISNVTKVFGRVFIPKCCILFELKSSQTNFLSLEKVLYCCCFVDGSAEWFISINAGMDRADAEIFSVISLIEFSDKCKLRKESAKLPQLPSRCCIKFLWKQAKE